MPDEDEISIEAEYSVDDDDGGSSGGSTRRRRTPVRIRGTYGTELLRPDNNRECEICEGNTVGVARMVKGGIVTGVPLCDDCREEMEEKMRMNFKGKEWDFTLWEDE